MIVATSISLSVPGAVEVQTLSWIQTQQVTDSNRVAELQQDIHLGEAKAIVHAGRYRWHELGAIAKRSRQRRIA